MGLPAVPVLPSPEPAWLWFRLKLRNELVLPGLQSVKEKKGEESEEPGSAPQPGRAPGTSDCQATAQTVGVFQLLQTLQYLLSSLQGKL